MNLSTHLKIGQRIYFTGANARNVVLNPLEITLAVFVISCPCNLFARTMLYVEDLVYYTRVHDRWNRRKQGTRFVGWVEHVVV